MKVVSGIKTIKKGSKGYEAKLFTKSNLVDFTEITEDQELFIDGSPSVVTSDGREPVTGYAGGTYIPATVNIDGVEYPNPSWYDGTSDAPVAKERGCYGFFESWTNLPWREASDWTSNGTITKIGNYLELSDDSCYLEEATTAAKAGFLLKKTDTDTINIREGYDGADVVADYTFSTGVLNTDGSTKVVVLSNTLAYFEIDFVATTGRSALGILLDTNESVQITKCYSVKSLEFTPPYGQDGNASSDNRAYNCDKWDQPISFTFKPQFDYDTPNNQYILSGGGTGSDSPSLFYLQSSDYLRLFVYGAGFNFGHNGTNWTVNSNPFTDNSILQEEHTMEIYIDTTTITTSKLTVVLDGLKILDEVSLGDLSAWNKPNLFHIGFRQNGEEADTYISNFCVHPKTQELPLDTGIQFTDPNKQYGRYAKWFLDQFGNTQYGSMLSSAGGVVEEGSNVNGSWVRFENGLLLQWATEGVTITTSTDYNGQYYSNRDIAFPVAFKDNPSLWVETIDLAGITWGTSNTISTTGAGVRVLGVLSTNKGSIVWLAIGF